MKRFLILSIAVVCITAVQFGAAFAGEELFDTKAASSLYQQGMENLREKKLDQAISEFEEALSISPEARTYYFLGYAYYLKGKSGDAESRKQAIENFEKAYELEPNFTPNKAAVPGAMPAQGKTEPQKGSQAAEAGKPSGDAPQPKDAAAKQP